MPSFLSEIKSRQGAPLRLPHSAAVARRARKNRIADIHANATLCRLGVSSPDVFATVRLPPAIVEPVHGDNLAHFI